MITYMSRSAAVAGLMTAGVYFDDGRSRYPGTPDIGWPPPDNDKRFGTTVMAALGRAHAKLQQELSGWLAFSSRRILANSDWRLQLSSDWSDNDLAPRAPIRAHFTPYSQTDDAWAPAVTSPRTNGAFSMPDPETPAKSFRLGRRETEVLVAIQVLGPEAYGAKIILHLFGKNPKLSSGPQIYQALERLSRKGLVDWRFEDSSNPQPGRARRIFSVSPSGARVLATPLTRNRQRNLELVAHGEGSLQPS